MADDFLKCYNMMNLFKDCLLSNTLTWNTLYNVIFSFIYHIKNYISNLHQRTLKATFSKKPVKKSLVQWRENPIFVIRLKFNFPAIGRKIS